MSDTPNESYSKESVLLAAEVCRCIQLYAGEHADLTWLTINDALEIASDTTKTLELNHRSRQGESESDDSDR